MTHIAVCVDSKLGRIGFVLSAATASEAVRRAEAFSNRVGYVGGDSFAVACRRALMMERDEPGAWGPLADTFGCIGPVCKEASRA